MFAQSSTAVFGAVTRPPQGSYTTPSTREKGVAPGLYVGRGGDRVKNSPGDHDTGRTHRCAAGAVSETRFRPEQGRFLQAPG
jgi:hypothetical protein